MNDLSSDTIGVFRRELRDARSVVANIDHRLRKMFDGSDRSARPAGFSARLAACHLLSHAQGRPLDDVVKQNFRHDGELAAWIQTRAVASPAMTTVPGWLQELTGPIVADVASNLLRDSVLSQLRLRGLIYDYVAGGLVRVPYHQPAPAGAFVAESNAIPVIQVAITSLLMEAKKLASISTVTREMAQGAVVNLERTLQTLMSEDLTLTMDSILLSNGAVSAAAPAGLLNGLTSLVPTAGGGVAAVIGDIKLLLTAIAPSLRPTLLANSAQATAIMALAPGLAEMVIIAPYLAASTVIALDAAAFASALGAPEFSTSEESVLHMDSAPTALSAVGSPNTVAAPERSLWQTACLGLRTIIPTNWLLRRANSVAFISGVTW